MWKMLSDKKKKAVLSSLINSALDSMLAILCSDCYLKKEKKQTLLNADSTGLVEKNVLTGKWQTTKLLKSQTWERSAVS